MHHIVKHQMEQGIISTSDLNTLNVNYDLSSQTFKHNKTHMTLFRVSDSYSGDVAALISKFNSTFM